MRQTLSALIAVLTLAAGPAVAGIVDSPIPAPFTKLVYSVPGVINNGGVGTNFLCTNSCARTPILLR